MDDRNTWRNASAGRLHDVHRLTATGFGWPGGPAVVLAGVVTCYLVIWVPSPSRSASL